MKQRLRLRATGLFVVWAAVGTTTTVCAQSGLNRDFGVGIVGRFDAAGDANLVTISSQFTAATSDRPAMLMISARIAPDWHIYSITQPAGGPQPTKIRLTPSTKYRQIGPFRSFPPPKSHIDQLAWKGLEVQEHEGEVTWYAPIAISVEADPAALEIEGTIEWQVCRDTKGNVSGQCIPQDATFRARIGEGVPVGPVDRYGKPADVAPLPQPTYSGTYQAADSEVKLTGHLEPAVVRPGDSARLVITATPSPGWHVYAYAPYDNRLGSKPTLISFTSTSGLVPLEPKTDAPVKTDNSVESFGPMRYYEGPVTWTTQIDVPASAPPGEYSLRGIIGFQACEYRADGRGSCEFARAVHFQGTLKVDDTAAAGNSPLIFAAAKNYADAALVATAWGDLVDDAPVADTRPARQIASEAQSTPSVRSIDPYDLSKIRLVTEERSFGYYIAIAFVGGLILNLMPCVLPVIGLKVMSFVQQAGKSRTHALVLNLWYAAGIVAVFLLLGILAVVLGLSWGAQFGSTTFNVVIAAIIFAMALSLLGIWEVPIPGFFGRGTAQELAAKEGALGAFFKGVITTILATPCGAPFMAPALFWATSQPIAVALSVFASVGLGMASPYLVAGVFPELLRFLPKPGPWMTTFKQLSGFVLLATVVFILFFMNAAAVVPTVLLLLGIGMACWLVSRVSPVDTWKEQLQNYALSGAVIAFFGVVAFGMLYPNMQSRFAGRAADSAPRGWEQFSLDDLKRFAVNEGKTVLVDFSADWCASCKVFEATVLHSEAVQDAIAAAHAVTMYADFTNQPPEIKDTLKALGSNGVPVIAVFPGDRPYEPIVFSGGYTQSGLIAALEQASGRKLRNEGGAVAEATTAASR